MTLQNDIWRRSKKYNIFSTLIVLAVFVMCVLSMAWSALTEGQTADVPPLTVTAQSVNIKNHIDTKKPTATPQETHTPQATSTAGPDIAATVHLLNMSATAQAETATAQAVEVANMQTATAGAVWYEGALLELEAQAAQVTQAVGNTTATAEYFNIAHTQQVEQGNAQLDDIYKRLETDRQIENSWRWLVYGAACVFVFSVSFFITLKMLEEGRKARQPVPAQVVQWEIKQGNSIRRPGGWPESVSVEDGKTWALAVLQDGDLSFRTWTGTDKLFDRDSQYAPMLEYWRSVGAVAYKNADAPQQGQEVVSPELLQAFITSY